METMELKATKREILGKKVESLRQQGILPAVIFGKETGSIPISINYKEFFKVFKRPGKVLLLIL